MLQVLEEVLQRRHSEGWLVGGTVRDCKLGRFSPDLDVVVADDPAVVAGELARLLDSPWFALSARHGAYRVLGSGGYVDIARMRGGAIFDDLAQRDFTINAMASPVFAGDPRKGPGKWEHELLDPFNGQEHLRARLICPVSDRIFVDDPLRLMRAVRFCHLLGFRLQPALANLIRSHTGQLARAATERIVSELALVLNAGDSASGVRILQDLGLLGEFLPEAVVDGGNEGPRYLEAIDGLLEGSSWPVAPWNRKLKDRLAKPVDGTFSRPAALRLATLVHRTPPGSIVTTARRLKLSRDLTALLRTVGGWFSRCRVAGVEPEHCLEAVAASPRSMVTFVWETAPWGPDVVLIAAGVAAARASRTTRPAILAESASVFLGNWANRSEGLAAPPFDGTVLMRELGLTEGPLLGQVVRETRLAWESGEVVSLDEALQVARAALASISSRDGG
ncbi:MAG: hypothetical protein M1274_06145 [Actinobacteria bacterium]|nr:hypothetical protein [Actinomycetota bacterium]